MLQKLIIYVSSYVHFFNYNIPYIQNLFCLCNVKYVYIYFNIKYKILYKYEFNVHFSNF